MALGVAVVALSPAGATTSGTTEGCTPGFWKNHPAAWLERPTDTTPVYTPSTPLTTISASFSTYLPGWTFGQALQGGGGPGLTGAAAILARAATAAWLNATVEIAYPYRRYQTGEGGRPSLVSLVTTALDSGDRSRILAVATTLDNANNLGCPLGGPATR
ncbi:MAG: hypothetical protein HYX34_15510 [Actinobacteria bacterium]|nr:hypothetical protein [Actinomycetota bacterium]